MAEIKWTTPRILKTEIVVILIIALFAGSYYTVYQLIVQNVEPAGLDVGTSLVNMGYSLLITASLYLGCRFIWNFLQVNLPWGHRNWTRIIAEASMVLIYSTVVQFIILTLVWVMLFPREVDNYRKFYFTNIIFGNTITIVVTLVYEGVVLFRQWRESLVLTERLKKENVQSQYESLRQQVNPHFLFNSLNVLSSLIRVDPDKAERFVDEFASVYRYILEIQDKPLISLREELRMLESFLYLQKIRFEEGLQVDTQIPPEILDRMIPPLTLLELVNNALKHNRFGRGEPMHIVLEQDENKLLVRNDRRTRKETVRSTGTGLINLKRRFVLMGAEEPEFLLLTDRFEARIPLFQES
ncbi:MAG: histidine kinase [Bacteroidota bacterium]|nr:histidine kinase [Bacteroidota bacterium]